MNTVFLNQVFSTLSRFRHNEHGNFAVIMAIGSTVLLAAVGAAVDISGVASEKARLQNITDSAVLAASASGETKIVEIKSVVDDVMALHQDELRGFTYKTSIVDDIIEVNSKAVHETAFMAMFGRKTIGISTRAGAPVPSDVPVHISLVVDTTESMAGDNLDSLQAAAGGLVETIEKAKDSGAKMAVVPFGNYVNIGEDNRSAAWINVPADSTQTEECYMYNPVKSTSGCTTTTQTRYNDGVPEDYEAEEGCVYEYEEEEVEYCPPPRDVTWRGCAGSRNEPLNITPEAASGSTEIPGAMDVSCGSEILPLTDNFDDVTDTIDALTTRGNTYLPTGLIWGWRTLSSTTPFPAPAASDDTIRAMVFMTDGGNTMGQYDKEGTGDETYHRTLSPDDDADNERAIERMLAICDGIKADGITIYTVGYKLPSGVVGDNSALKSCASSGSTAFSAENSKELKDAFGDIGKSLASVRLTY